MASTQQTAGMVSPPGTPQQPEDGLPQGLSPDKEDTHQPDESKDQKGRGILRGKNTLDGGSRVKKKGSSKHEEGAEAKEPSPEASPAPARQQEQTTSPTPPRSNATRGPAPISRPPPQTENSETSLVCYTLQASSIASDANEEEEEDDDDDAENIPRDPRSFPRPQRSPHLAPPTPPFHGFMDPHHGGMPYEYEETTETETDVSSTYTQFRRRDLGRDTSRRRSRRERRGPPRYDEYAGDEDEDYGYQSGQGRLHGFSHGQWGQEPRARRGHGYADRDSDMYASHSQDPRPGPRSNGAWASSYRQRHGGAPSQDEHYSYDDESGGALVLPDPPSKKGLRRERSVRKPERGPRPGKDISGRSETRAGGSNLRLQMSLDLEVEVTLKAKIQGGIEFSLL